MPGLDHLAISTSEMTAQKDIGPALHLSYETKQICSNRPGPATQLRVGQHFQLKLQCRKRLFSPERWLDEKRPTEAFWSPCGSQPSVFGCSNRCLTSSHKKLLETSASLLGARSY